MKKALFITFDSPHIDRRILQFAKSFKEMGIYPIVLCPFGEIERGFEDIEIINLWDYDKKVKTVINIKEILKKYFPIFLLRAGKKLYRKLFGKDDFIPFYKEFLEMAKKINADIYIACDLPTLPIAYEAKLANKSILIYDAHEFYTEQVTLSKIEKKKLTEIEKNLIKHVDVLITVNDDIANLFKERYGYNNVITILNAINCKIVDKKSLHKIININEDIPILLFQGGFSENRNLEKLVKISTYLEDSTIVLLGWGILEKKLIKLARDLDVLNKKVFFVQKVSQAELLSLTSSATLGIIPYPAIDLNTKYCTPNKFFEFLCAEVPIIANKELITVNNLINMYKIGTSIDMNDLKTSARLIKEILGNQSLITNYKKNLSMVKNSLSWEKEKDKIKDIIVSLNL